MNHAAKNHREQAEEGTSSLHSALKLLRHESEIALLRGVGCTLCWLLSIVFLGTSLSSNNNVLMLFASLFCLVLGAVIIPKSHSPALKLLEELQDIRAVPGLVMAVENSFGAKVQAIRAVLTRLLPRLTVEDAGLLNRSQLAVLRRELEMEQSNTTREYSLAIVSALVHVGNQETAFRLQELIKQGAFTERQLSVRASAQEGLPTLQARLTQEEVSGTLLRAASATPNASDLLHPILTSPDSAVETLLQPANRPAE